MDYNKRMIIGGCVLAGGKASRANGMEKEQFKIHDQTFLENILTAMKDLDECFISYNKEKQKLDYLLENINQYRMQQKQNKVEIVADIPEYIGKGPMSGLLSILEKTNCDGVVFCPCDVPFFDQSAVKLLTDHFINTEAPVILKSSGKVQPLCGIYPKNCVPYIQKCLKDDELKIKILLDRMPTIYLEAEKFGIGSEFFYNVNSLEDFEKLPR